MAIGAASMLPSNVPSMYINKYEEDNVATRPSTKTETEKQAVGHESGMNRLQADFVQGHEPYNAQGGEPNSQRTVVGGVVDVYA